MRVQNIEVTNAIEALACWLALEGNGWKPDPRVRGARKMRRNMDLSFAHMRKPGFYVTQPMRQATVQPLRALPPDHLSSLHISDLLVGSQFICPRGT
jgi:hypothetical protein